jgi:hypothetical protein
LPSLLIGAHPSTGRCFQRLRNIDHLTLLSYSKGDTKSRMKFSLVAFTSLLTTDPVQGYHAPAKEGFFMDELGQPGSCKTFRTGKLTSVSHSITPLIICYIII